MFTVGAVFLYSHSNNLIARQRAHAAWSDCRGGYAEVRLSLKAIWDKGFARM